MQPGRILLCAVVADGRAPGLVAVARRWANATSTRPLFVHVRPRPVAAAPAGQSINAGSGDGPVPKPLAALGIAEHELHAVSGRPAGALLDIIGELHPWLIVVASSSHGGRETVKVGHVCAALVRHSPSPVLVMPPGADAAPSGGPIACAISFGDEDEAAVRFAVSLAIATNRGLALAHVLGVREAARLAASRARDSVLGSAPAGFDYRLLVDVYEDAGAAPAAGEACDESVSAGAVADRLLEVARDTRAHALVIGARNSGADRDGVAAWVSRRLWTSAPCPVVVVG